MKHLPHIFLPAALLALLVAGCGGRKDAPDPGNLEIGIDDEDALPEAFEEGGPSEPSAYDIVRAQLEANGLEPGYDASSGRLVSIGQFISHEIANPAASSFAAVRDHGLEKALHAAKFDILELICANVESTEDSSKEPAGTPNKTNTTVVSVNETVTGLRMLAMAESWTPEEGGVYEVAVAVGWSEKWHEAVMKRLLAESGASLSSEAEQEWLDRKNLASLVGPAAFSDPDGNLRMLGIGAADAETPGATARAEAMARKFAAFSFPTAIKASRKLVSTMVGDEESLDFSQEYDEAVDPKPRTFLTVLSTEAVHPISGRKMAVVVVEAIP